MSTPKAPQAKPKQGNQNFDLDADKTGLTEMPSITKLLARKSMAPIPAKVTTLAPGGTQTASKSLAAHAAPTQPVKAPVAPIKAPVPPLQAKPQAVPAARPTAPIPAARPAALPQALAPIAVQQPTAAPPPPSERTGMIVMPARRSNTRSQAQDLLVWDRATLQSSPDSVAQALSQLMGRGLGMALYLAHHLAGSGNTIPVFKAQACFGPGPKQVLWKGLSWNPALTPTLWQQLSMTGAVELTPPDTGTNVTSERNMVRTAFGIDSNEYLVVARVGPPNAPKGMLGLVSTKSFLSEVQKVLMLLAAGSGQTGSIKKAS